MRAKQAKEAPRPEPLEFMPYGKYAGVDFEDIPEWYINWIVDTWDPNEKPLMYEAAENELIRRKTGKRYGL